MSRSQFKLPYARNLLLGQLRNALDQAAQLSRGEQKRDVVGLEKVNRQDAGRRLAN